MKSCGKCESMYATLTWNLHDSCCNIAKLGVVLNDIVLKNVSFTQKLYFESVWNKSHQLPMSLREAHLHEAQKVMPLQFSTLELVLNLQWLVEKLLIYTFNSDGWSNICINTVAFLTTWQIQVHFWAVFFFFFLTHNCYFLLWTQFYILVFTQISNFIFTLLSCESKSNFGLFFNVFVWMPDLCIFEMNLLGCNLMVFFT